MKRETRNIVTPREQREKQFSSRNRYPSLSITRGDCQLAAGVTVIFLQREQIYALTVRQMRIGCFGDGVHRRRCASLGGQFSVEKKHAVLCREQPPSDRDFS